MINKHTYKIPALKVHQWLKGWDKGIIFSEKGHRRRPSETFYIFSLSAKKLRSLSGIYRRETKEGVARTEDKNIQRAHDQTRSQNIREFIKYGYPWSELSESLRKEKFDDLRKPGWLPTAIVVNILGKKDKRNNGKLVDSDDLVCIDEKPQGVSILLPKSYKKDNWKPKNLYPIEIIDGQHRLFAFDEQINQEDYELPVVAFYELDISWQAYLFWTINIKPKRINPSLAFDLYPLLRTEEWLDRFEGHKIYREARAQELTEALWVEKKSSWYNRINMLGAKGSYSVTQAAWIRALLKSYVKSFEGPGVSIGGLFGAPVGKDEVTIPWSRQQQAALLILIWNLLEENVKKFNGKWARNLRTVRYTRKIDKDPAFAGPLSLFNDDQGISVVLQITNDILFLRADDLNLKQWDLRKKYGPDITIDLKTTLIELENKKVIVKFLNKLTKMLASFDWRSSGTPGLSQSEKIRKLSYRGGSGYREFRRQLLEHLGKKNNSIGKTAKEIYKRLGFDKK